MAGYPGVAPDAKLLECDGCGSLAREDLVTEPTLFSTPNVGTMPSLSGLAPFAGFDPIQTASGMLKGIIPEKDPETRTERLVRELILSQPRQGVQSTKDYARSLVICASHIEAELDARDAAIEQIQTADVAAFTPVRARDFKQDFLTPAMQWSKASSPEQMCRIIAVALDCAIAYGALEGQTTNPSLKLSAQLEAMYWDKVSQLRVMVYG
jgi:hypothetical protein